jgi:hypothetical protein
VTRASLVTSAKPQQARVRASRSPYRPSSDWSRGGMACLERQRFRPPRVAVVRGCAKTAARARAENGVLRRLSGWPRRAAGRARCSQPLRPLPRRGAERGAVPANAHQTRSGPPENQVAAVAVGAIRARSRASKTTSQGRGPPAGGEPKTCDASGVSSWLELRRLDVASCHASSSSAVRPASNRLCCSTSFLDLEQPGRRSEYRVSTAPRPRTEWTDIPAK